MNSELDFLLADPDQAGAVFITKDVSQSVLQAAHALHFMVRVADLAECVDHDTALAVIARALEFPEWYGANWDALADCMSDLSWLPGDGYLLLLDNAERWRRRDRAGFETLLDICRITADFWREIGIPFWTVAAMDAQDADIAGQ